MIESYKADITLNQQDSMQDMLNLEKDIVKVYSTALTEGTSKKYRTIINGNLSETAEDQMTVYLMMTDNGYLKAHSAMQEEIQRNKEKFVKISKTFS